MSSVALALTAAVIGTAVGASWDDRSNAVENAVDGGRATNVILFVGDGMGEPEITLARDYTYGAAGELPGIDALPFTGDVTTYAVQETAPTVPDYVPDSAAAGTAWATGLKTSNGRISTRAGTTMPGSEPQTILELAQRAGFATGNVSTAEITDATPAVLDSHVPNRGCQGPQDMSACASYKKSAGGPGSIAEQTVDHAVDVVLGGGESRFLQVNDGGPYAGKTVEQQAEALGYRIVRTRQQLLAYDGAKKLLGLFNRGNMTTEWNGALATSPRSGPQRCVETNRPATEPTLAEMTQKALRLLDDGRRGRARGKTGFFLQVEGASIDKQDHAFNPCAQIGETVALDKAVQVALDYRTTDPDTLVIVTADHAHASQIVPQTTVSPGRTSTLVTNDATDAQKADPATACTMPADGRAANAPGCITVNYATSTGSSQTHTGQTVRIGAVGPQAANVLGLTEQTGLFRLMARAVTGRG